MNGLLRPSMWAVWGAMLLGVATGVRAEAPVQSVAEPEHASSPSATVPSVPYGERRDVHAFIEHMAERHGFERGHLLRLFQQVQRDERVLAAIQPSGSPGKRSWQAYRRRFVERRHIERGLVFWQAHAPTLHAASERFGVPPEVITSIIGIETFYGRVQGRFPTLASLTTLAFDYPPRADLFRRELEEFLLLARENQTDPLSYQGSYAGALGQPQFLPSSLRRYAVDFDGDQRIDLSGNTADAIGSVASFLAKHGWQSGGTVAVQAKVRGFPPAELLDGKVEPHWGRVELRDGGISPLPKKDERVALVDLATPGQATEYWLGYPNFYVIARYNRSSHYAMAVFQLAEKLRQGYSKLSTHKSTPHHDNAVTHKRHSAR